MYGSVGPAEPLVGAAENHIAVPHHHHFAVYQTKPFAFNLENDLALFVDNCVLGTDDNRKLFIS